MNDVAKRMKDSLGTWHNFFSPLIRDGADEIERLTKRAEQAEREISTTMTERLVSENHRLRAAAKLALHEMCNTKAPRNSFTDAVDALDAALGDR